MKYIIIGLGSFGSSLAQKLTEQGNEVIGIDTNMSKVDAFKEKISHTICMDATDEFLVSGLPLKDTDVALVAIGEDQGANIMTTALLKNFAIKRLISRAVNPLHEKVLQAIGVDAVIHPEEESANRWAKKLSLRDVVNTFELNKNYSIVEAKVPGRFIEKTIEEVGFNQAYNLLIITVIKDIEVKSNIGKTRIEKQVQAVATPEYVLQTGDVLVVYGNNKDIQNFLKLQ